MRPFLLLLVLLSTIPNEGKATDLEKLEQEVIHLYEKVDSIMTLLNPLRWRDADITYTDSIDQLHFQLEDSLVTANEKLERYLLSALAMPNAMAYPFHKLREFWPINITSSDDGQMRTFVWNTEMGGTMIDYGSIAQYCHNGKEETTSLRDGSLNGIHENIYSILLNGKTYYILIGDKRVATLHMNLYIGIVHISQTGGLMSVNKIRNENGDLHDVIQLDYYPYSDTSRPVIEWKTGRSAFCITNFPKENGGGCYDFLSSEE